MTSFSAVSNQSGFPAALTKDKRLCRSLVNVLLSRVHLAAAAAQAESAPHGDSWRGAATAAQAAVIEALRPALQHQLDGASGMAILESAAQLMLRAPTKPGQPRPLCLRSDHLARGTGTTVECSLHRATHPAVAQHAAQ